MKPFNPGSGSGIRDPEPQNVEPPDPESPNPRIPSRSNLRIPDHPNPDQCLRSDPIPVPESFEHPIRIPMIPVDRTSGSRIPNPGSRVVAALRRFRHPLPIRVHVKQGKPSSVSIMRRGLSGGAVDSCAGPWRTSGGWWESGFGIRELGIRESGTQEPGTSNPRIPNPGSRNPSAWDRDEWDVALTDGPTYRLFRERHSDRWFLEGVVD